MAIKAGFGGLAGNDALIFGYDTLNDGGCLGPIPTRRLELFYRIK
jgi:hypothetical protein